MFLPNLPENVAFAEVDDSSVAYELHPAEQALLSPHAGAKRRAEFRLGRAAANLALQRLGFSTPGPVLKGERREPIWPEGVVGALSHSAGRAVAAVGFAKDVQAIGLDLQQVRIHDYAGVLKQVATAEEQAWLRELPPETSAVALAKVFSAKESIYKAFNGRAGEKLFFSHAAVHPTEQADRLRAKLFFTIPGLGQDILLGCFEDDLFVLTTLVVPA